MRRWIKAASSWATSSRSPLMLKRFWKAILENCKSWHKNPICTLADRGQTFRFQAHDQGLAFQLRMSVRGELLASSATVLIKNRWPSGETTYSCCGKGCKAPPKRVANRGI